MCITSKVQDPNPGFFFFFFFFFGGGGGGGGWGGGGGGNKRIQIQKSRIFFFLFGGGGGGRYVNKSRESCHFLQDTFSKPVCHNWNIQKDIQFMEQTWNYIWNLQGEITQKVCKWELSFLYLTHHQDVFYITVKYHDKIRYQRVFRLWSGHEIASETIKGK